MQFHVIRTAEDLVGSPACDLYEYMADGFQPVSKHGVRQVVDCFACILYGIVPRRVTGAEPLNLGKYIPHPMGSFLTLPDFCQRRLIITLLRFQETLQVVF